MSNIITDKYFVIENKIYSKNTDLPYRTELGEIFINQETGKETYVSSVKNYVIRGDYLVIHNAIKETIAVLENPIQEIEKTNDSLLVDLENNFKKEFPNNYFHTEINNNFTPYADNISILYKDIDSINISRLEFANALGISFMIFLTDNWSNKIKNLKIDSSLSSQYSDNGLKFDSEQEFYSVEDCLLSIENWFWLNKEVILNTTTEIKNITNEVK